MATVAIADSPCRRDAANEDGSLAVSQDALRTRFIENWCKVVQTVEHSNPLLRLGSWVYLPVRGLWRDGLEIRFGANVGAWETLRSKL